jgi:hypothetical protein
MTLIFFTALFQIRIIEILIKFHRIVINFVHGVSLIFQTVFAIITEAVN